MSSARSWKTTRLRAEPAGELRLRSFAISRCLSLLRVGISGFGGLAGHGRAKVRLESVTSISRAQERGFLKRTGRRRSTISLRDRSRFGVLDEWHHMSELQSQPRIGPHRSAFSEILLCH